MLFRSREFDRGFAIPFHATGGGFVFSRFAQVGFWLLFCVDLFRMHAFVFLKRVGLIVTTDFGRPSSALPVFAIQPITNLFAVELLV